MKMIIGGAYQGKLEYAKNTFNKEDVYYCREDAAELDLSKPIIYGMEKFVMACVKSGIEAKEYLQENRAQLEDKIVICTDVSQGIVPMEAELRAMREMNGRACIYLAAEAEEVHRVFCGLGQKIKG